MRDFEFLEPTTVEEASQLLAEFGEDCRVMAGGSALMLAMRQRMLIPTHVISVARVAALQGITFNAQQGLRIGALSRHIDVAESPLVLAHYPMLAGMAARLANPQVRNQGTLGGNLCYADPATDPPTCLMALDAQVVLGSVRGERVLSMEAFLVDYYVTALEPDELVIEIRVPPPPSGFTGRYTRYLRTAAEHRPLVNAAIGSRQDGNGYTDVRLVVGASTPVPCRVPRAEAFLTGKPITASVVHDAAQIVATDIDPISDQRGSAEFRRNMVQVVTRRLLAGAFGVTLDDEEAP